MQLIPVRLSKLRFKIFQEKEHSVGQTDMTRIAAHLCLVLVDLNLIPDPSIPNLSEDLVEIQARLCTFHHMWLWYLQIPYCPCCSRFIIFAPCVPNVNILVLNVLVQCSLKAQTSHLKHISTFFFLHHQELRMGTLRMLMQYNNRCICDLWTIGLRMNKGFKIRVQGCERRLDSKIEAAWVESALFYERG